MAPSAVVCGFIILVSFFISHSETCVENTSWVEPAIVWITVGMPTGSGKSSIFKYLLKIVNLVRKKVKVSDDSPLWHLDVATFEKMGALMDENDGRLLGIYDEITTFLTQINLYKSRGHTDPHNVAVFLRLYNGHPWSRKTGKSKHVRLHTILKYHCCYLFMIPNATIFKDEIHKLHF